MSHTIILNLSESDREALRFAGLSEAQVREQLKLKLQEMVRSAHEMRGEVGGGASVAGASRGRADAAIGTPLNDPGNPPLGAGSTPAMVECGERSPSPTVMRGAIAE